MREGHVRTEFIGDAYAKRFGLSEAERITWTALTEFLRVNKDVQEYTAEEEEATARKLEELHRKKGLEGILHVVTSPGTAAMMRQAIPPALREHFTEMYYQVEGRRAVQTDPAFVENLINVSQTGDLSPEDEEKMARLMANRVGMLIGGGPGYPDEPSRTPFLRALEKPVGENTSIVGACLGNQDLGVFAGGELMRGVVDAGPHIERATDAGKIHPVTSRLVGPSGEGRFGSQMFNTAVVIPPETATVLGEGVSTFHRPVTTSYKLDQEDQGLGAQGHAEIPAGTPYKPEERLTYERIIPLDGEQIVIPAGTTEAMAWMVQFGISAWDTFKAVGMTPADMQALVHEARAYPTLGRNFIGPAIDWMAKRRLKSET